MTSTRVVMSPYPSLPAATVPRGQGAFDAALAPPGPAVTPSLVARGGERHRIFCTPCHGPGGRGDGIVVSRGFPRPPSYFDPRLHAATPEHIVTVVTNGIGAMLPYAERVPPADRWAIAHYVKALQAGEASPPGANAP